MSKKEGFVTGITVGVAGSGDGRPTEPPRRRDVHPVGIDDSRDGVVVTAEKLERNADNRMRPSGRFKVDY